MKLFELIERMRDISTSHRYIKSFHTGKPHEVNKQNITYPCVYMSFPYTKNTPQGFGVNDYVRYSFDLDILTNQYYGFEITGTTSADTFNTNYMISSDVNENTEFKDENKLRETALAIGQHIISKMIEDDFQTIGYDLNLINYQIRSLERVNNDYVTGVRIRMEVETSNPYLCEYETFFTVEPAFHEPSTANMELWLKADSFTSLNDGDLVDTWEDSSGNGKDFLQTNDISKPQYKVNIQNGLPSIFFDLSNLQYSQNFYGTSTPLLPSAGTDLSIYTVFTVTGTGGSTNGAVWGFGATTFTSTSSVIYLTANANTGTDDRYASTGANLRNIGLSTPNQPKITSISRSGTNNVDAYYNDATTTDGTLSLTPTNALKNDYNILGNFNNNKFEGYIHEIIIFNVEHTLQEREDIYKYLKTKWGF